MCRKVGDYAWGRIVFTAPNTEPGDIEIKVGWTYRKVNLPRVFATAEELTEYVYRHLFYSTSVRMTPVGSVLEVASCRMGSMDASQENLRLNLGETGAEAKIELLSPGEDNVWIDFAGNRM